MYRPYEQCETPNIPCPKPIVPAPSDSATMNLLIEHVEPLLKTYSVDIGFYGKYRPSSTDLYSVTKLLEKLMAKEPQRWTRQKWSPQKRGEKVREESMCVCRK